MLWCQLFARNGAARAASLLCLFAKLLNASTVSHLVSPGLTRVAAVATEQSRTQQKMRVGQCGVFALSKPNSLTG